MSAISMESLTFKDFVSKGQFGGLPEHAPRRPLGESGSGNHAAHQRCGGGP